MMPTISKEKALKLMGASSKYSHSILVSKIMKVLAKKFGEDEVEWELVGLLHDLDYDQVQEDMSQHGIKAADILRGKLSERSLHAIKSHDFRTEVKPETLLDESLIFADSLAVFIEEQHLNASTEVLKIEDALQIESSIKPWITKNILPYASQNRISISQVLKLIAR